MPHLGQNADTKIHYDVSEDPVTQTTIALYGHIIPFWTWNKPRSANLILLVGPKSQVVL